MFCTDYKTKNAISWGMSGINLASECFCVGGHVPNTNTQYTTDATWKIDSHLKYWKKISKLHLRKKHAVDCRAFFLFEIIDKWKSQF